MYFVQSNIQRVSPATNPHRGSAPASRWGTSVQTPSFAAVANSWLAPGNVYTNFDFSTFLSSYEPIRDRRRDRRTGKRLNAA